MLYEIKSYRPIWNRFADFSADSDLYPVLKRHWQATLTNNKYAYQLSVTNMLTNLKLPSLEHRRTISSLILFYKIIHNLINIPSSDLIPITSCTRGHHQRFRHIYARTSLYSNSFFPRTIRIWNSLSEEIIWQQSLPQFKSKLKSSHYYWSTLLFTYNYN